MSMHVLRSTGFTLAALLALAAGESNSVQACCFPWLWGCCYNRPYTAGYYGGYGAGYYGGYSAYGGCGYASAYPAAGWGGCSSCVGSGCATCVGGGCGISTPYRAAPVPESQPQNGRPPVDQFERGSGAGSTGGTDETRSRTFDEPPPAAPGTPSRRRSRPGTEGLDENRGTGESESSPTTDKFERPIDTKKEPIAPESTTPEDGAAPESTTPADDTKSEIKANRPELGPPSQGDKPVAGETVIPRRQPAPIEMPPEPALEDDQPADALELRLDDTQSTFAVAPKARLPLKGRFSSPSIVRLRLRPNAQWTATPDPARVARH